MKSNVPLWCSCVMLTPEKYPRFKKNLFFPHQRKVDPSLEVREFWMVCCVLNENLELASRMKSRRGGGWKGIFLKIIMSTRKA